jgi:hypothetical protein
MVVRVSLVVAVVVALVAWASIALLRRRARTRRNLPRLLDAARGVGLEWPERGELAFARPSMLVWVVTKDTRSPGPGRLRVVGTHELAAPPFCWVEVLASLDGDFPAHLTIWPRRHHRLRGFERELGDPFIARTFAIVGYPKEEAKRKLVPEVRRALAALRYWQLAVEALREGASHAANFRAFCSVDEIDAPLESLRAITSLLAALGHPPEGAPYR